MCSFRLYNSYDKVSFWSLFLMSYQKRITYYSCRFWTQAGQKQNKKLTALYLAKWRYCKLLIPKENSS